MNSLQITRILAPTDFSDHSYHALEYARELAHRFTSELHLLNVIEPAVLPADGGLAPMGLMDLESELVAGAERSLVELRQRPDLRDLPIVTAVSHGRASSAIIDYAAEHEIGLIVIATHGRTGLGHLIFGSTAERVIREAPCPVLTIRPH